MPLKPVREVKTMLPSGGSINTVMLDDGRAGLECINKDGEITRAAFSPEAVGAIMGGWSTILAGGGKKVESGWHAVIPENTLVVDEEPS